MGKHIHVLAIAAFVFLEVILAGATTISVEYPDREPCDSDYSSSEEDYSEQNQCTKPNEVYDVCPASCPPRVCGIDDRLILCQPQPKPGDPNCNKPACRCEDGTYRDNKGNCVVWEKCHHCPNPNEVYDECFSPCLQGRCDYDPRLVRCAPPPKLGDPGCVAGCRCADGYVRNEQGACVKEYECKKCRNKNEVYDQCFSPCLQKSCNYDPSLVKCAPPPKLGDPGCVAGCRCAKGFVRNENGFCVRPKECKCPNKNEVYDQCFSPCLQKRCDYDPRLVKCAPPPKLGDPGCVSGCRCAKGFVRNEKGACVREKECNKCPNRNEIYDPCFSPCLQKSCDYNSKLVKCAPPPKLGDPGCTAGCRCVDGYIRNRAGACIRREQCTTCGGDDNAKPGCGVNCGSTCSDIGKKGPIACPEICNLYGCDCKPGFYYDKNQDKCVRPKDCTQTCKTNEVFSSCANGGCRRRKCTDIDGPILCIDPLKCKPGCICADGFYQDDNGNCVSKEQCQSSIGCKGDRNAKPGCGTNCGKKCSDVGRSGPGICPLICILDACDCKDGYYYDENTKRCVLPGECTPQCQLNEELSPCANGICRVQDCKEKGKMPLCPPMTPESCRPGCVCKMNYLRQSGECIPEKDCVDTPTCKPNEVFSSCANGGCRRRKCTDIDGPILCIDPLKCEPGCICADGFYQDDNGNCVSKDQCQSSIGCKGDRNAKPGCGTNCGKKCSDVGRSGPGICPLICILDACDCKDGYYYDENTKRCVLPGECTQTTIPTEGTCNNTDSQLSLLRQANYDFTGKMLYQVMKANPAKSVVTSAFSVLTPLAQLFLYSKGTTASEIVDVLKVKTKQEIRCAFPLLLDEVKAAEGTDLSLGAKVYVKKEYNLSDSFNKDAKEVFRAEGESIDFSKAKEAAETINKWVSEATKGKITDLVSEDLFSSLTRLVLANAIYFKGTWKTEFNSNITKKEDFYVNSQTTKKVDMMQQKGEMDYFNYTDIDAQIVQLPYKDENITFLVILPNQKDGILNLVEKLQDGAILDRAVSSAYRETVKLFMPKFDISTSTKLKNILKNIGVKTIFTENSQLDGMIVPNEPLFVSDAIQKATITVDEKGSVAAAANAFVGGSITSVGAPPPRQIYFRADHPYVYCIKVRKILIFCGVNYG